MAVGNDRIREERRSHQSATAKNVLREARDRYLTFASGREALGKVRRAMMILNSTQALSTIHSARTTFQNGVRAGMDHESEGFELLAL
jgi:hypothetical protein